MIVRIVFISLLLAASAIDVCSQQQTARLFAGPGVLVNGAPPLAQEVLPGDKLRIPANSAVHLNHGEDSITLGSQSEATYEPRVLTLIAGTGSIQSNSMLCKVHKFTLSPTKSPVKYEVVWHDLHGWVTVLQGELKVTGGVEELIVPAGKTAELDESRNKAIAYLKPGGIRPLVIAGGAGAALAGALIIHNSAGGGSRPALSAENPSQP